MDFWQVRNCLADPIIQMAAVKRSVTISSERVLIILEPYLDSDCAVIDLNLNLAAEQTALTVCVSQPSAGHFSHAVQSRRSDRKMLLFAFSLSKGECLA